MKKLNALERTYKAAANRKRLHILVFLKKKHSATVGTIAKTIGLKHQATSKHLQILESAGFLSRRKRGLFVAYRLYTPLKEVQRKVLSSI
ncbi:MAG: metalloregulator ArsR/SmtB family transcription factor [Candidatus Peribacteraceae bacterium]|jgi:DNA-binding MarR family transcriptional regulator|nr:metalloregulator ArsR/SmtB family transcription factor [Candidatus Peribacteraceae bacterium]MDP7453967.1 metalloregulator ArsR/SmtB family transcription factor [Candidatus Peribacteraceae bacterium]MDP7645614.1 metalloregulator ArsR/SmtB family transcription factor [Candidatus Peribacteraceae bacterium]|tara:strand:- start:62 stop:331 length:270 start_codon:yes stop_codon:yes gene_type:complete